MNQVKTNMSVFSIDFCRLELRKKHQVTKSGSIFFTLKETFTIHNVPSQFNSYFSQFFKKENRTVSFKLSDGKDEMRAR